MRAHGITTPDGKIVPGWLRDDGVFVDLDGREWLPEGASGFIPPAGYLDENLS